MGWDDFSRQKCKNMLNKKRKLFGILGSPKAVHGGGGTLFLCTGFSCTLVPPKSPVFLDVKFGLGFLTS